MNIKLLKPHEHDGQPHKPDDTIEVPKSVGEMLIEQKVGVATSEPKTKPEG